MSISSKQDEIIKILYVNLFTWLGGGEYSVYNLVKHTDPSRFHPILMFNKGGPFVEKVKSSGIETVVIPYVVVKPKKLLLPTVVWRNLRASLQIKRFIRQRHIDVIQCSDVFSLILLLPTLLSRRIPVIYSVIIFYSFVRCMVFNLLALIFVRNIVTNSLSIKEHLLKRTFGLSTRTQVAYNGVDSEIFYPRSIKEKETTRRRVGLPLDKKIVGLIGRFEVWKGHFTFLQAAQQLLQIRGDIFFLIVGGAITKEVAPEVARYHNEVLEKIDAMHLNGQLLLLENREDVAEIMAALDVFVCPSDYEPFGLVALEAFASGVPVVASRTVGAVEVLNGFEGVYVAEPRNPTSFTQKIIEALGNRNTSTLTGSSVKSRFSWRAYASTFEELYSGVVR